MTGNIVDLCRTRIAQQPARDCCGKEFETSMKKKAAKRRSDIPRPYNGGKWTDARMRSFAMSALRRASWPPRHEVINRAYIGDGINPKSGRKCKMHKCEQCLRNFPKGEMKADHKEPVIPIDHNWASDPDSFLGYNWNKVMRRLWIEAGDGWNVICTECHAAKTDEEKKQRAEKKKLSSTKALRAVGESDKPQTK